MAATNLDPELVPDEVEDNDSSLGEDTASSTQSLASSIIDYRRENGRTYHKYKEGKYNLPNDDLENERLDLQYHLLLLTFGDKLGLAPPNEPESKVKRVLDLGTGTGIWAIDFADEHPESEVIGIDLSPIQPDFVPPNVRFIIDDMEEEWNYSEPFDYIHSSMMTMSVGSWKDYIRKAFENLAPGGYMELQEVDIVITSDDGTLTESHTISKWCKLLNEACNMLGRPWVVFDDLKTIMEEVGFTDVVDRRFKWPTNPWPKDKRLKELGRWNLVNGMNAFEAVTMAPFTRAHGWTKEEVDLFLVDLRKESKDQTIHGYLPICSVYGKKPEA